jgi:hypothetical protein
MNNFFCLFISFFFSLFIFGQKTVSGKITNLANEAVIATVLLKESSRTISFTISNNTGNYVLKINKTGDFQIVINALNYEPQVFDIQISSEDTNIEKHIQLLPNPVSLKEIVIKTLRPITVEEDKIIFDASSFAQGNEQVVEDLLKKIPGVNVGADGSIRVGNQEVEKVMIDGEDMFEKGYKILTKNMPVNPIDKIELLKRYSNNKHLKGIENSNKVALNLTLKEDFKRQWFGNAVGGYGLISENRYDFRANLMNFGKKNKYYFVTNLNNLGVDAVGDVNMLVRPFRFDEPGSIGDNQSANRLLGMVAGLPNLKQKRVNFNNAEMLSLNSIFTLSDKVKVKALGFLNTDENDFFRNSFESFAAGTTSFQNTEDFVGRKTKITGFGKLDLTYDITKNQTLEYTGKFNTTNEKNSSDLVFNADLLNERLNTNNQLFDQKIVFTNKYKDKKVFLLSGRYINEKTPQNYSANQFLFQDLFVANAKNTKQFSENSMQFAGIEGHLLDKKENGDLLELKGGGQFRLDHLNTRFKLGDDQTNLSVPDGYQNNLTFGTTDLYASIKYRFKINNFTLLTQSDFHQLFNRLENFDVSRNESPFFIIPKIGLDWKINEKNKIMTSYSHNTTNAGVLDVYSGFVQTGFRSLSKGLDDFNQLNSSSAILNYSYGSWGDKFFANSFLLYSKNNDFYSTNSTISQNYSQSEKIIIKDREFVSLSSSIDRYFKLIQSNLKVNLGASKTNFKNIVNNSNLREVKNFNADYGLELRSGFRGFFNYHIGSKWNYNQVKTTITNDFTDNMSFLDLSMQLNDNFNLQVQGERYFFGNLNKDSNKYYFLDIEARYVLKPNKLTFFLSGNNLLNTQTFKNYSVSDISISQTEYKLVPRYVLLKMEYRF